MKLSQAWTAAIDPARCAVVVAVLSSTAGCAVTPSPSVPAVASAPVEAAWDDSTTFLAAPELAKRLLHNLVRIDARAINEHGLGLIVGADDEHVYVLTAGHVVGHRGGEPAPAIAVEVRPCAPLQPASAAPAAPLVASVVPAFDPVRSDLAVLKAPRPAGYVPVRRVLAPTERIRPGEAAWQLGRDGDCVLVPMAGAIANVVDDDVLADLKDVRGGGSGGVLLTGWGAVGIVSDSDGVVVVSESIERARTLVQLQRAAPWLLEDSRNVPPGEPLAARLDLTEMLNRYLFAVRDAQFLLQQPVVARDAMTRSVATYNAAIGRFRDARDKYDGTLRAHWPPAVADRWVGLRDALWAVHRHFLAANAENARVFERERTTPAMQAAMQRLDPELISLERDIGSFLHLLNAEEQAHGRPR